MKIQITNYTFDASAKTITFNDYVTIEQENILLIANVTDQLVIYQFNKTTAGGTVATNVLTLEYNTTAMDDADKLLIYYDDGNIYESVGLALAISANIHNIGAALSSDKVMDGLTVLTPKFAAISAGTSGNNTIVAAVTGKKIRVLAYTLSFAGTVNAKWQSGASGTDKTGLKYGVANTQVVAPFNPVGWFETASATLLNLNLSGTVVVGGEVVYVEVLP